MKRIEWMLSLGLVVLALFAVNVYAQSPREELTQMVEQLQKTPTDNALREKIIKLARTVKPAPAVPEEAQRREGRAKFASKNAKSNDDYLSSAREYEEAVRVAPWIPGYYSDLCTIYEKAEKYVEAKRHCEFSLIGLTDTAQVSEIRQRIAGLEFGIEKADVKKAEQNKIARAEEEKRQAIQAKRDVITQIKNAVNGRRYLVGILSYRQESKHIWDGVNENELFGNGMYYIFSSGSGHWKFFDERVELWSDDGIERIIGEPSGSRVTDMRWFWQNRDYIESKWQLWGYFNVSNGYFYTGSSTVTVPQRPLDNSKPDPARRYIIYLRKPSDA